MLKTLEKEEKENWAKHLQKLTFAYNATVNKSTGFSPYYLMFGRYPRLPIDSVFGIEPNEGDPKMQVSYAKYVQEWEQPMNQAFEIANRNAGNSRDQNKMCYDKKVHGVDINVRDRVKMLKSLFTR